MRSADPARCAADLLAQAEHGPDSEAHPPEPRPRALRCCARSRRRRRQRFDPRRAFPRRGDRPLGGLRPGAPRALGGGPGAAARPNPKRRHRLRAHVRGRRRLCGRRDARPADGGLARGSGGLGSRRSSSPCRSFAGRSSRAPARSGFRWPASKVCRCTRPPWSWREGATAPGGLSRLRVVAVVGGRCFAARSAARADPALRPEHAAPTGRAAGAAGGELRPAAGVSGRNLR